MSNDDLKQALRNLCRLWRERNALTAAHGESWVQAMRKAYENDIREHWIFVADLRAREAPDRFQADEEHPGYVRVRVSELEVYVPFHLVPALPEHHLLLEAIELSRKIRLGADGMICLSGSTLLLKDLTCVGDVDFCEYIPQFADHGHSQAALSDLLQRNAPFHRFAKLKLKSDAGGESAHDIASNFAYGSPPAPSLLAGIVPHLARARNGKTAFLSKTTLAGATEVTSCLLFYRGTSVDDDPVARLSFASQEAPLNAPPRRALFHAEPLGRYIDFLLRDMREQADKKQDPVKATKRAIPLLRLFGETALLDELLIHAQVLQAFPCASVLARLELHDRFIHIPSMAPLLQHVHADAMQMAHELFGSSHSLADLKSLISQQLQQFASLLSHYPGGSIWERISRVAVQAQV